MNGRQRFTWKVVLSSDVGETRDVLFSAFWSPAYFDGRNEAASSGEIARACAAQVFITGGKKQQLLGVSAELVPPVVPA